MDTIILSVLSCSIAYGVVFLIAERARKRKKANKDQLTEDINKLIAERTRLYSCISELGKRQTKAKHTLQDIIKSNVVCGKDNIEEVKEEVEEIIKKAAQYYYDKTSFRIQSIYVKHEPYGMLTNLEFTIK